MVKQRKGSDVLEKEQYLQNTLVCCGNADDCCGNLGDLYCLDTQFEKTANHSIYQRCDATGWQYVVAFFRTAKSGTINI